MFTKAEYPFNQPYDEAYMSVFQFGGNKYFAEHNIPLSSDEIGKIVGFVSGALAKMDDGALEQKWGELLKLKNQVQVEQHKKEPHTRRGYPGERAALSLYNLLRHIIYFVLSGRFSQAR